MQEQSGVPINEKMCIGLDRRVRPNLKHIFSRLIDDLASKANNSTYYFSKFYRSPFRRGCYCMPTAQAGKYRPARLVQLPHECRALRL
jgi:hypothetical protein